MGIGSIDRRILKVVSPVELPRSEGPPPAAGPGRPVVDTFETGARGGPVVGFVPPPETPPDLGPVETDSRIVAYEKFIAQGPPERSDFSDPAHYQQAHDRYAEERDALAREAGPAYVEQVEAQLEQTPTGAAVLEAARRAGVEVEVLSDEEYQRRFGGSTANATDEVVYVRASAISGEDGASVLLHEFVHALVDSLNPEFSDDLREAWTAAIFEKLGLDPADGARIAEATEGWSNEVAAEHVATHVLEHELARQQAGLPPESPEERARYVERTAEHELAIDLRNRETEAAKKGEPYTDEQLLEDWASTPQGRANPPPGDTAEEQAANLRAMLETMASEEYAPVDPPAPPPEEGTGTKVPGGN